MGWQGHDKMQYNSLAPGIYDSDFKVMIFQLITQNSGLDTCWEIALIGVLQNLTNERPTLV